MAGVSDSVVEEIKARVDLEDLISSYGIQLKRSGSSAMACCPFHNEKTPSFNVNASRGFYHCFGCGESGDAIKFVMKYEGLGFIEAVKKLASQCGVKIEEREDPEAGLRKRLLALMAELAQFYHRCLGRMAEAAPAREYLARRDLDGKVQDDFLIGYAPNGVSPILKWAGKYGYTAAELEAAGVIIGPKAPGDKGYHRFGGRIMFSIKDRQGRVVAFSGRQIVENKNSGKYVNSPETAIFKKSNILFGFDRAAGEIARSPHREAIVCEGQIDTIRLHISGFPVAVASQGTAFTESHAKMLGRVADAAVLVFDDDAAGHKATVKTAAMLLAAEMPVRVVSLPGGDDPDSFLRTKGAQAFQALLDGAESIVSFQCRVDRAKEANPKSIDAVKRVSTAVLSTISSCPSAILRASLADEAARLLGLPVAAVNEELEKIRAMPKRVPRRAAGATHDGAADVPVEEAASCVGESAAAVEPPPAREMSFAAFLLANENDSGVDATVGEFLPREVFAHAFTWRFVETWRAGLASGEDAIAAFADSLDPRERAWFDEIMLEAGRSNSSSLTPVQIAQEYVRLLWGDCLTRRRGAMPADGGPAADVARMKISDALMRLKMVKWNAVKELVRKQIKEGENHNGPEAGN